MYIPCVTTVLPFGEQYCVLIRLMDEGGLALKLMLCHDIPKNETFVMVIVQNIPGHNNLFYWHSGAIVHLFENWVAVVLNLFPQQVISYYSDVP
jgi:hypothetical protein